MKLLREPLLHFFVAGALLFAAYGWWNRGAADDVASDVVRITEGDVAWLRETWTRQWQRRPSRDELRGLVADHLREEMLSREARALGLDQDDTVVRRRLAQKLEFMVRDTAQLAEPTDEDLRRLFDAERGRFITPARVSFTHVFFDRESRGVERAAIDARAALEVLSAADSPSAANLYEIGDSTLLPRALEAADEQAVAAQFGAGFARAVLAAEPRKWSGPIESAFGLHLVRIDEKQAGEARPFEEVRDDVTALWHRRRQDESARDFYAALLEKYDVVTDESVAELLGPMALAHDPQRRATVRE